jgi:hypothetical protein
VFIRANAEGTDTYELNRNLLLNDGARADSVANLEIDGRKRDKNKNRRDVPVHGVRYNQTGA